MKKLMMIAIAFLIPATGLARVADFNALIAENSKAQKELHTVVKKNLRDMRENTVADREPITIVEESTSYNSPTPREMLAFKKERVQYRASDSKKIDRFATEISDLAN